MLNSRCSAKDKDYYLGQYVSCESMRRCMGIDESRYLDSLENDEIGEAWQYKMRYKYCNMR